MDKKQHNNNGNMVGEIYPMNVNMSMNVTPITSVKDCAQRIETLFNKYGHYLNKMFYDFSF